MSSAHVFGSFQNMAYH